MENPDDPDFEDFVVNALNTSFSSNYNDDLFDSDMDQDDILINNIGDESENETDMCLDSMDVLPLPAHEDPQPSTSASLIQQSAFQTRPDPLNVLRFDPVAVPPQPADSVAAPLPLPVTSPAPLPPSVTAPAPLPSPVTPPHPTPTAQPLRTQGRPTRRRGRGPHHIDPAQAQNPAGPQPIHWANVSVNDPGPSETLPIYNVNKGPVLPSTFDSDTQPIDYFSLFFNDTIIDLICSETNLFANNKLASGPSPKARITKWQDITPIDFKAFLGVIINMGLMPLPNITNYFSTARESNIPFFSDIFSKNDFERIFWNLHFTHRNNDEPVPRGFLIAPILEHMKKMCRLFFTPGDKIAIDESTISFKGKVYFRVYNPNKPVKFGMKLFVVSDSTNGYIYDFIPYFGSEDLIPGTNLLKTTQIVKVLSESVVFKDPHNPAKGVHVYTDRYYTSPELADELMKIGCYLTGTVMTNRTGLPPGMKAEGKKMKKGDIRAYRKKSTVVVSWKDKRPVHMLSTKHKGSSSHMSYVNSRWPNRPPVLKPDIVIDYIKHMGGVDRSDHFVSSYQFMRRTKKWYRKMFFWFLEVAIINSYLLYKDVQSAAGNRKAMNHFSFRKSLVRSLVQERSQTRPKASRKRGRPVQVSKHFYYFLTNII